MASNCVNPVIRLKHDDPIAWLALVRQTLIKHDGFIMPASKDLKVNVKVLTRWRRENTSLFEDIPYPGRNSGHRPHFENHARIQHEIANSLTYTEAGKKLGYTRSHISFMANKYNWKLGVERKNMIVIKVEVWPGGNEKRATEIARGTLANDLTGTEEKGNYVAEFISKEGILRGRVTGLERKQNSIWRTIRHALEHVLEKVS